LPARSGAVASASGTRVVLPAPAAPATRARRAAQLLEDARDQRFDRESGHDSLVRRRCDSVNGGKENRAALRKMFHVKHRGAGGW